MDNNTKKNSNVYFQYTLETFNNSTAIKKYKRGLTKKNVIVINNKESPLSSGKVFKPKDK